MKLLREFKLQPFDSCAETNNIDVCSKIFFEDKTLIIQFKLIDGNDGILIPLKDESPLRKKGLWSTTCFEFFCKNKDSTQYWEWNVSPNFNWNVYVFKSYRSCMENEEKVIKKLKINSQKKQKQFEIDFEVDFEILNLNLEDLQINSTCVLEHKSGFKSYWAVKHPVEKADFHALETYINL